MPPTTRLLNSLLYFPARRILETPAAAGLAFEDVEFDTADGERLHAWWIPAVAGAQRHRGHVLLFHGNAGNIGDRVIHAALLAAAGFDVFSFDYRGYGRSTGRPSESGTYLDARAARAALLQRADVEPQGVLYLGESLGGAIALELAIEHPPGRGLVLMSTFTSVRAAARRHYPFIPPQLVPDAYPSLTRIAKLQAPLLVLHGDQDGLVPLFHGEELYETAPEPKHLHVFAGAGHNDLITLAGAGWASSITAWVDASCQDARMPAVPEENPEP